MDRPRPFQFPASRVSAKPMLLTLRRQKGARGRRRNGCMGAAANPARSLAANCRTNLVFAVGLPVSGGQGSNVRPQGAFQFLIRLVRAGEVGVADEEAFAII